MCAAHHTVSDTAPWDQLGLGIHICAIYSNKDEQFTPVASFFNEGLSKREQCVYIFDENSRDEVLARVPTPAAPADLEIVSYFDAYTTDGAFNAEQMLTFLKDKIDSSLLQGYTGVRASGEMTWALTTGTSLEELLRYEQKLNNFLPVNKLTGVCQYNEARFSPEFLIEMIRSHPYLLIHGKLYENKYFFTDPEYIEESTHPFKSQNYETILSIITEESSIHS